MLLLVQAFIATALLFLFVYLLCKFMKLTIWFMDKLFDIHPWLAFTFLFLITFLVLIGGMYADTRGM